MQCWCLTGLIGASLALGLVLPVTASAAGADTLSEITVTARKREERLLDVPIAVTVREAAWLERLNLDEPAQLFRQVPGLSLTTFDDGRFAFFQMRGIGPLSQALSPDDGSVVTYLDGVPQSVYASETSYLDLERIEVLRGPQGTLFGRNSQGGAIQLVTRAPGDTLRAGGRVEAGGDQHRLAELSLEGPLVQDMLAGRVSARYSDIDGHIDNVAPGGGRIGGREVRGARATLRYTPRGDGGPELRLMASGDRRETTPFYYALRDGAREVQLNPDPHTRRRAWQLALTGEFPIGDLLLTSVTSFNGFDNRQFIDDTEGVVWGALFGTDPEAFLPPLDFSDWHEEETRFYQELRVEGDWARGGDWITGLTFFTSRFDADLRNRSTVSPFIDGDREVAQDIDSYALFGEVSLPLADPRLSVSLGARFTRDEKDQRATFTGAGFPGTVAEFAERADADFNLWTGRAVLRFVPSDTLSLYASLARGAKSGGFPRFLQNAAIGVESSGYASSRSWTAETGLKTERQDGRGGIALAAYYNEIDDEQLFVIDFDTFVFQPENLSTRSYGLEAELRMSLGAGWELIGGAEWARPRITEGNGSGAESGNRIPNVPRVSTNIALAWDGPDLPFGTAGLTPRISVTHEYVGARAADVQESFELPDYHRVDLRAGVAGEVAEVYAFARNITNTRAQLSGLLYGPGVDAAHFSRGRVVGIGLSARFGGP